MTKRIVRSAGDHDPALDREVDSFRFAFGDNWQRYLADADDRSIKHGAKALGTLLELNTLEGTRFLDAGSGSGVFSLAARRLGADVVSFDFDEQSVACTQQVKSRYAGEDDRWTILRGSVLDRAFLESLGTFDVVYSWGVLHHTGDMWAGLENVSGLVRPGGKLCIALYNDQGFLTRVWRLVKRSYNWLPRTLRPFVFWPAVVKLWAPTMVRDMIHGRPFHTWKTYGNERGMSPLVDARDWIGGYPFEVATPAQVISFCSTRGFVLANSILRSGIGCNEFIFTRARTLPITNPDDSDLRRDLKGGTN